MAQSATSAGTIVVPPAGRYSIDPAASRISFSVGNLLGLRKVGGTFSVVSGEITVADPVGGSSLRAVVDPASIDTANAKRDHHVKGDDFLATGTYPEITVAADRVVERDGASIVVGTLTVHGVTQPVELTVVGAEPSGTGATFRATTKIVRKDFGVAKMKGMIGPVLTLTLDIVATKA